MSCSTVDYFACFAMRFNLVVCSWNGYSQPEFHLRIVINSLLHPFYISLCIVGLCVIYVGVVSPALIYRIFKKFYDHVFILHSFHVWYPRLLRVGDGNRPYKLIFNNFIVKKFSMGVPQKSIYKLRTYPQVKSVMHMRYKWCPKWPPLIFFSVAVFLLNEHDPND